MVVVSVINTVRNGVRFIDATIASIRQQSFESWELIVVDDGSTDPTPDRLERLAAEDNRIRVVRTPGVGRGRALALATTHASGEFVANIDADDPSHPDRLAVQVGLLRRYDEFALLCSDVQFIRGTDHPRWTVPVGVESVCPREITKRIGISNEVGHSSVMMRRAALDRVGGYDARRQSQLDYDLWVRMAAAGLRLGHVPIALASKRLHDDQAFENGSRLPYLLSSLEVQRRAVRLLGLPMPMRLAPWAAFGYGLLPRRLRMGLRTIGNRQRLIGDGMSGR